MLQQYITIFRMLKQYITIVGKLQQYVTIAGTSQQYITIDGVLHWTAYYIVVIMCYNLTGLQRYVTKQSCDMLESDGNLHVNGIFHRDKTKTRDRII